MRRRLRIAVIAATIAMGVLVAGSMLHASQSAADQRSAAAPKHAPPAPKPARNLEQFYSRRAYPGAPPVIPHALLEDRTMGGKSCLGCHRNGGFVAPFKAWAPVTPHPDLGNCRQCHVPQQEVPLFGASQWTRVSGPPIDQKSVRSGAPRVPHTLQMRENCVACHAGDAAVAEIRSPHPERGNCQLCHLPASPDVSRKAGTAPLKKQ